jgi:aryl-alcohol dehydrogenase-like predicted oxidoreductase
MPMEDVAGTVGDLIAEGKVKYFGMSKARVHFDSAFARSAASSWWMVPIPGTTKLHRFQENLAAADRVLAPDELTQIEAVLADAQVHGERQAAAIAGRQSR